MARFRSSFEKRVFQGARWAIVYGSYEGVEQFAINELQRMAQFLLPYVIQVLPADTDPGAIADDHLLVEGTRENNAFIRNLAAEGRIDIPAKPGGYAVACMASPLKPDRKIAVIAGHDPQGVLYGVEDFNTRVLGVDHFRDSQHERHRALDDLPAFSRSDYPRIDNRGIWTWGYVIYDYRRFIDNMARLRMNLLTTWNDCPPVNARQIADYAHARGVRIVMGFHWGWGTKGLDLGNAEHVRLLRDDVLQEYETNYAHLPLDGIYFQTLTETGETAYGGVPIVKLACDAVNTIGRALLERHPGLWIQFGLHATSILENYVYLENLDPRITITWEDAGTIPYAYRPYATDTVAPSINTPEKTIEYSLKLARLRGGREFAMVPKGFSNLDWTNEFENHGPYLLGERCRPFVRDRHKTLRAHWDLVNGLWMANYPHAARFFREILAAGPRTTTATALVEDGLFEAEIHRSVALLAHVLWNPHEDEQKLPVLAASPYYRMIV